MASERRTSNAAALFDRRLLVVAGKGGVGRTTIAASLAVAAARAGKRVLLAQTKSKDRLPRLFGSSRTFTDVQPVDTNLWAVNMTPEASLREYGVMILHSTFLYRQVFERDFVKAFLRAIPGLHDYSMLGKIWFHTTEQVAGRPRFDLVILDGPATGHALTLLAIPKVIIDTVPEGPLTGPARECYKLLTDPARTQAVLVTLAEDLPVSETLQLSRGMQDLGIALGPVVVNRLYPPRFRSGAPSLALAELLQAPSTEGTDQSLAPVLRAARLQQKRSLLNEHYIRVLNQALPALPQLHAPYIFSAQLARLALDQLADRLSDQLIALSDR